MTVTVTLPAVLAERAGGQDRFEMEGDTVEQVLRRLAERYPELGRILWREAGEFNPILLVFRNDEGLTGRDVLSTPLGAGDELSVISALEGG